MARITGAENSIINRVVKNSDPAELLARIAQSNQFLKNESERQAKRDVVLQQRNANKGAQAISPTPALPTAPAFSQEPGITAQNYADEVRRAELERLQQKALTELRRIENEAAYASTVEQADEIEKRRKAAEIELNATRDALRSVAPESVKDAPNWGKVLGIGARQGLENAGMAVAQGVDFLVGGLIDEGFHILRQTGADLGMDIDWDKPNAWDRYLAQGKAGIENRENRLNEAAGDSKAAQAVAKYTPMVTAAVPQAVLAIMSGGTSTAAQATTGTLQAASGLANAGRAAQLVQPYINATRQMMVNPSWQYSFASSAGSNYEEALSDGATQDQAALYALLVAGTNATIETGGSSEMGGIDKLPKQIRAALEAGDKSTVLKWVKSLGSEIGEELLQGSTSNAGRTVYDPNVQLYSATDEKAVINPQRMGEEAKGAAIVSAILGGGQIGVEKAFNAKAASQNAPQQTQTAPLQETAPTPIESGTKPSDELNTQATRSVTDEVMEMLVPGISNSQAAAIMSNPEARAAQGNGAMVPTQTNSSNPLYTAQERRIEGLRPEDSVHLRHTDQAVDNEVERRYTADKDGEKTYLFEGDRDWTDADTALAHRFLADAVAEARKTGDYSEVVKLQREWERQGTRGGQALRQRSRFTATPEAIVAEAAEVLFGEDSQTRKKLKPQRKSEIMDKVADYANRFNEIPAGDTQAVVGMIKELSVERRTTGLFAKNISKTMNWALEQAASYPDGDAFLRDVLTTQIRSVAGDYAKPSAVNQIKQVRFLNMLSKLNTFARNIVANNILDPMETMSNNLAVPLDMLLSKFTGTRSVAVDKGWLSSAKRKGTTEGFIKSYIQVALDADTADVATKYEQRKGRTFKMTGGPLERLFSTWEMLEGFALKTTDEAQKGGIRAEAQRGIDKLKQDGKIADDALTKQADSIALERTLQNKGAASSTLTGIRSALNNTALLRDEQGGELGLGEVLMPFANVPANATVKAAQYTPAGIIDTGRNLMQVLTAAKRGSLTPEMQARFVQSVGRSTMGVAMTALSCAMALKGLIKVAGSNDKDEEKALAAQGMKGTQINLSATYRWLSGGDPTWQDGDTLMDIGFAEQINANLAMGAALADECKLDGDISLGDIANANAEALLQAVLEMPAVSQISGMVDAYNYSDSETEGGKLADAAIDFLGSAATSFLIPNALRGIATGFDNTVRNTYASDSKVGQALDYALAGIPGLRNKLAPAVDNWGEEKTHTDNLLLNVLNANVLPGSISRFKESPMQKEMARLSESGIENIYPDRNAPNSITIDGAKYALTPEQKDAYLRESGNLTAKYYREFMQADIYADLDDELRGEILRELRTLAESEAKQSFAAGLGLETESSTVSNLENPVEFIATRTAFNTAVDARDYGAIDALLETARELDPKAYKTFVESTGTQALLDAAKAGVDSEAYYAVNDIAKSANDRRGGSGVSDADRLFGIANADISSRERDAIAKVLLGETLYGYYEKARDAGYSAKDAANIYSRADANGKNGVSQAEMYSYIQRTGASSEEAERLWALFGWSTSYSRYRPK